MKKEIDYNPCHIDELQRKEAEGGRASFLFVMVSICSATSTGLAYLYSQDYSPLVNKTTGILAGITGAYSIFAGCEALGACLKSSMTDEDKEELERYRAKSS